MVLSLGDRSRKETPQNLALKFVKDMAMNVLESNKMTKMFQAMAIFNLKMGNLGLQTQTLKTRLTRMEEEK